MPYTFVPKEKHAKAYGNNMRISTKKAEVVCAVIRNKKLTVVKRLLDDLLSEKRNLDGKHYTHAVEDIQNLIESCEKNADHAGLDKGKLFVHASAHEGTHLRRGRRKSSFGSRMKVTNVEIMLIGKGRGEIAQKK